MRSAIREQAGTVLGKYIIFSKAELDSARNDWLCFGCWGTDAGKIIEGALGKAPTGQYGAVSGEHFHAVQLDAAGESFECFINTGLAPELAAALAQGSAPDNEDSWRARTIRDGIARIENATVEEFVPQTLNYDLTGHISFSKGCYTGQEVVARLHYRGTPKRRAFAVTLPEGVSAAAGDKVFASDTGKAVGDVINVASPDGEAVLALVSATSEGLAGGRRLEAADGPALTEVPLPYSVEAE